MSIIANKHSSVITPNVTYPKNSALANVGVCTTNLSKAYGNESYCVPQLMAQGGSLYNNSGNKNWGSSSSEYLRNTITESCCSPPKVQQNQNSMDSSYIIEQRKRQASGAIPLNRQRAMGISPEYQSSKDVSIWSSYTGGLPIRKLL
jgi:hypothetical protein